MKARIKLISLWTGNLPSWYEKFLSLIKTNKIISFDLIEYQTVKQFNTYASNKLSSLVNKHSPYAAYCDLRPMYGHIFEDRLESYDYWGWCDLDIIVGNLDKLLEPLLTQYDIISTESYTTNGAMTLLRNVNKINYLYQSCRNWRNVIANPAHWNFDEGGTHRSNPDWTFHGTCIQERVNIFYDNRSWSEGRNMLQFPGGKELPSRTCRLVGKNLIEEPTNRELLLYHLSNKPKTWPLNDSGEWIKEPMVYRG